MLASPVLADLTGDLRGAVTDATGAGVSNAKVTLKSLRTGAARVLTTSATGEFLAPPLEGGGYRVTVEKEGFKSLTQNATGRSGEETRIDTKVEIRKVAGISQVE